MSEIALNLEPPLGGFFVVRLGRQLLALQCWVQIHLTALDIVQIMHAHTAHALVVGLLRLARTKMSKPKV
jgi:hypothetical protein